MSHMDNPGTIPGLINLYIPWSDQVGHCEQGAQQNADSANNHVSNPHEGILTTDDRAGREQDGLSSIVLADREF